MEDQNRVVQVTGRDGLLGWIDPKEQPSDTTDRLIRLSNGQAVLTPAELLLPQEDGSYYLPLSSNQFESAQAVKAIEGEKSQRETLMVIPVIVEQALVGKKLSTRNVRISKRVNQREEWLDTPGFHEEVQIERVPVNKEVDRAPGIRSEGQTMIIPLVEEVLVVEKRLVVREEVRVTLKQIPHEPQPITLRSEELELERIEKDNETE